MFSVHTRVKNRKYLYCMRTYYVDNLQQFDQNCTTVTIFALYGSIMHVAALQGSKRLSMLLHYSRNPDNFFFSAQCVACLKKNGGHIQDQSGSLGEQVCKPSGPWCPTLCFTTVTATRATTATSSMDCQTLPWQFLYLFWPAMDSSKSKPPRKQKKVKKPKMKSTVVSISNQCSNQCIETTVKPSNSSDREKSVDHSLIEACHNQCTFGLHFYCYSPKYVTIS